ncbi:MAG: hypothetical protein PT119_00335 [Aphanizomenon gracile PMC627.10]|jgi:hypothetical protein|nr:hypothetical protein [Aphanizomenon gracile PMC627.10]
MKNAATTTKRILALNHSVIDAIYKGLAVLNPLTGDKSYITSLSFCQ